MIRIPLVSALLTVMTGGGVLACAAAVFAADMEPSRLDGMPERARALSETLDADGPRLPLDLEFEQTGARLRADVYSVVEARFDSVGEALGLPASWCEILPLHFNVKACTYSERAGGRALTVYLGRKFYEEPETARILQLSFEVLSSDRDYFEVGLRTGKGPLGTTNYVLTLAATPLAAEQTLIHFRYAHGVGLRSHIAMFGYLNTLGRNKVGFSVVGKRPDGRPIHVGGLQGVIERNAVRYHLAVQSYLDTLGVSEPQRFERRIERWFDLTLRYREQLFEMERSEYLQCKQRERSNQLQLQQATQPTSVSMTPADP